MLVAPLALLVSRLLSVYPSVSQGVLCQLRLFNISSGKLCQCIKGRDEAIEIGNYKTVSGVTEAKSGVAFTL